MYGRAQCDIHTRGDRAAVWAGRSLVYIAGNTFGVTILVEQHLAHGELAVMMRRSPSVGLV